jgi:hypothetical protein
MKPKLLRTFGKKDHSKDLLFIQINKKINSKIFVLFSIYKND